MRKGFRRLKLRKKDTKDWVDATKKDPSITPIDFSEVSAEQEYREKFNKLDLNLIWAQAALAKSFKAILHSPHSQALMKEAVDRTRLHARSYYDAYMAIKGFDPNYHESAGWKTLEVTAFSQDSPERQRLQKDSFLRGIEESFRFIVHASTSDDFSSSMEFLKKAVILFFTTYRDNPKYRMHYEGLKPLFGSARISRRYGNMSR